MAISNNRLSMLLKHAMFAASLLLLCYALVSTAQHEQVAAAAADDDDLSDTVVTVHPPSFYQHVKRVTNLAELEEYVAANDHVFLRWIQDEATCLTSKECRQHAVAWANATRHFGENTHPEVRFVEVDATMSDTDPNEFASYENRDGLVALWSFHKTLSSAQPYDSHSQRAPDQWTDLDGIVDYIEDTADVRLCDPYKPTATCNEQEQHFVRLMMRDDKETWQWRWEKMNAHGPRPDAPKRWMLVEWNWRRLRVLKQLLAGNPHEEL